MQTVTAATCVWWSVLEECRWPVAHWTCWLHWGAVTVECSVWAQDDGNRGGTCTACRIQVRELGPYRSLDASMHFTAVYIQCLPGSHFQGWKVFFQLQFLQPWDVYVWGILSMQQGHFNTICLRGQFHKQLGHRLKAISSISLISFHCATGPRKLLVLGGIHSCRAGPT